MTIGLVMAGKADVSWIEYQLWGQSGSMSAMEASSVAVVVATSASVTWPETPSLR